jgi:hypothetical protein
MLSDAAPSLKARSSFDRTAVRVTLRRATHAIGSTIKGTIHLHLPAVQHGHAHATPALQQAQAQAHIHRARPEGHAVAPLPAESAIRISAIDVALFCREETQWTEERGQSRDEERRRASASEDAADAASNSSCLGCFNTRAPVARVFPLPTKTPRGCCMETLLLRKRLNLEHALAMNQIARRLSRETSIDSLSPRSTYGCGLPAAVMAAINANTHAAVNGSSANSSGPDTPFNEMHPPVSSDRRPGAARERRSILTSISASSILK